MEATEEQPIAEREDALTMGARLRAEEREASEGRIERAIRHGADGTWQGAIQMRQYVASKLYEAYYDGRTYEDIPGLDEVLETFCWNIFGCSFNEVLKAWDKALG